MKQIFTEFSLRMWRLSYSAVPLYTIHHVYIGTFASSEVGYCIIHLFIFVGTNIDYIHFH